MTTVKGRKSTLRNLECIPRIDKSSRVESIGFDRRLVYAFLGSNPTAFTRLDRETERMEWNKRSGEEVGEARERGVGAEGPLSGP